MYCKRSKNIKKEINLGNSFSDTKRANDSLECSVGTKIEKEIDLTYSLRIV